jgi:hypothetical protein
MISFIAVELKNRKGRMRQLPSRSIKFLPSLRDFGVDFPSVVSSVFSTLCFRFDLKFAYDCKWLMLARDLKGIPAIQIPDKWMMSNSPKSGSMSTKRL